MPKGQVAYMIFQNEGNALIRNVANNSPNVTYRIVGSLKFRKFFFLFRRFKSSWCRILVLVMPPVRTLHFPETLYVTSIFMEAVVPYVTL